MPTGQPVVTRRQVWLLRRGDGAAVRRQHWPIHEIGEDYLYSVHMLQHMMLSYFMPPLVLLATPTWLLRLLVGNGRALPRRRVHDQAGGRRRGVQRRRDGHPHPGGRQRVGAAAAPLHYSLHLLVVLTALLMWMPVVGPFPELRISYAGKMIYLFLQSVVPTVPAGWLTFAEGVVYKHYDQPVRVWGISATDDQQLAGAIMKIGGSIFLWTLVVFFFFKRFATTWKEDNSYRRGAADLRPGQDGVRQHAGARPRRSAEPSVPAEQPRGQQRGHDGPDAQHDPRSCRLRAGVAQGLAQHVGEGA